MNLIEKYLRNEKMTVKKAKEELIKLKKHRIKLTDDGIRRVEKLEDFLASQGVFDY
jgi:hypothetical protein